MSESMEEVLGEDYEEVEGEDDEVEGAGRRLLLRRPVLRLPAKPAWRRVPPRVTPWVMPAGVSPAGDLLQPLPLKGEVNNGVFNTTFSAINFVAVPQKPFRGERLLIAVRQTATSTVQLRIQALTIGTNVQSVQVADMPIEAFGAGAFGMRMKLEPCQPGVSIQCHIYSVGTYGTGETIPCAVVILGRVLG